MNVYDVLTPYNYSQTHSVIATSLSEAEKTYLTRYPGARILEIKLHAEYVVVADRADGDASTKLDNRPSRGGWFTAETPVHGHKVRRWRDPETGLVYANDAKVHTAARFEEYTNVEWDDNLYPWHLPSKEVLDAMYEYQDEIGGFAPDCYWSSLEFSNSDAWAQAFCNGSPGLSTKAASLRVRAVRALPDNTAETERLVKYGRVLYQAYPKDAPKPMTWEEAVAWCEALNKPNDKPCRGGWFTAYNFAGQVVLRWRDGTSGIVYLSDRKSVCAAPFNTYASVQWFEALNHDNSGCRSGGGACNG